MDEISSHPLYAEHLSAIAANAELDAEGVVALLRQAGVPASRDRAADKVRIRSELLVALALVVRFQRWECCRITAHTDAGLPTSKQVMDLVQQLVQGPELTEFVVRANSCALDVFGATFAWNAVLDAEVAIVAPEDDAILDVMADFFLKNLHLHPGGK